MPSAKELEAAIEAAIDKLQTATDREIAGLYRGGLAEIRALLGRLYENYALSDGTLTYAEMTKYNRLAAMHRQLTEALGPTLSAGGKAVKALAADAYEASYYMHGWALAQDTGADISWGLLNPEAVRAAIDKPYSGLTLRKVWTRAAAGTLSDIERAIVQGAVQGDSYPNMARRVREVFESDTRRALLIAQTEGHRLAVEGALAAYDEAEDMGLEFERVWDATLDARTRDEHRDMDGKRAENVGSDEDPHWQWHYPGIGWVDGPGLTGVASADINCRCRALTVFKGYEPKSKWARAVEGERGEVGRYQTYDEWAEEQGI